MTGVRHAVDRDHLGDEDGGRSLADSLVRAGLNGFGVPGDDNPVLLNKWTVG